jgi:hypothetical protein
MIPSNGNLMQEIWGNEGNVKELFDFVDENVMARKLLKYKRDVVADCLFITLELVRLQAYERKRLV